MEKESMIAGIAIGDSDTYISVMQDGCIKNIPGLMDTESTPSAVAIKGNRYLNFGRNPRGMVSVRIRRSMKRYPGVRPPGCSGICQYGVFKDLFHITV